MKNYFFRCTAIFILILSLGVGDMWGWSMMYLVGDHWNSWADQHRMWESTEGDGKRYVYIYMEQGYMFRFDMNVDNADPANMKPVGLGEAANLDDNDTGVRVAKYDTGTPQHINYSGEAGHTYSGIICVHSDQITTYDDDKKNADKNPFIWLTRPSVKIRHNWNGSSWTDETMTDKHNGKYEYTGRYGGNYTYAGITDNEYNVDGSPLYKKFTDATLEGSPVVGNRCLFEFNSSGYIGVDDKDQHRGSLKIIKVDTVTYNANGASSGTAPSVTEAIYNRASTLATNTGSLTKSNYYFNGWNTQADGKGTHYDAGGSITVVGNTTLYAEWTPQWTIKGSDSFVEDDDDDEMGDWKVFNGLHFVSDNTHRGAIILAAHTAYYFKVYDRVNSTYYGCGTGNNDYTFVGQTDAIELESPGYNLLLMTTQAGSYTFEWDDSKHKLKVTYPNTISHPSMDYVYMEKYSNWNSGTHCYIHPFYNEGGSGETMTTWGSDNPKMTAFTHIGNKDYYCFPILTTYPNFIAKNNLGNSTEGHETSKMYTSGHGGQLVYYNTSWTWGTFTVHIGLDDRGANTNVDPSYFDVAFNADELTDLTATPLKNHYDFQGFYTNPDGTGTQVIDKDGKWIASVSGYTDASKHWIHEGTSTTLYAKWTEHPYTITLAVTPSAPENSSDSLQGGTITVNGEEATSVNAYYVTETAEIEAVPANDAYVFKEWRFSQTDSEYDIYVSDGEEYSSTSNPIKIKAEHTGTLTAVFQCRYGLVGSRYDEESAGMPGWEYNTAADFAVIGFTSLGEGADRVVLKCDRTLGRATSYKFRIYDRVKRQAVGCGTKDAVLPAEYDPEHGIYNNWQLNHIGAAGEDVNINTLGRGTYTFHITNISDDRNYWPSVQVDRQLSYQVHMGWKHAEAENLSSLSTGDDGGTVTASVNEGGESATVANDAWVAAGSTISFTASPASSYYVAGWWSGDACTGDYFIGPNNLTPSLTVIETVNAFVKFVEKNNTFEGDVEGYTTKWNQVGNWSEGHIPTITEVAIVPKPVEVDIADAKAKRVLIKKDSPNNGQIEIPAGKELIVAQTIKKTTDGSNYGATGYEDIVIGSSLTAGNGALVMNTNDGTNKATVYFATKAKKVDGHNVNQFIGTPFNDENDILYDYYGTKIYRFMAGHDGDRGPENEWKKVASTGEKMNGFYGYNILTNQTTEPVMEMQGTLNRSAEETITGFYNGSSDTENMFANSWVAPIYIPNFEDDDFVNMEKTIYIFNAGTPEDQGDHAMNEGDANTTAAGQYCVLPINASPWTGMKVIPSMQAFSVFATDASPSLKFNYERLVYNPSTNGTATIVPTRAPRRTEAEQTDPTVLKLKVSGESGYAANIVMLNRADFSEGFDDGWDGRFLPGDDAAPQLYAVTADGNMAINCSPDIEGTLLGFKAGEADDLFTFTFEYDDEALYLYDTQTQLYTRVQTGSSYTFATEDGDAHNRFILTRKAPSIATGMEASNTPSPGANKVIIDTHLYIFRAGALYDALGRIIQ